MVSNTLTIIASVEVKVIGRRGTEVLILVSIALAIFSLIGSFLCFAAVTDIFVGNDSY